MSTAESDDVPSSEWLQRLLNDEELSDVALEGNDGVRVAANRCILASKSTVFRKMLFGEFVEASSPVVKIGFTGATLKTVLEYVYTDSAQILEASADAESETLWLQDLVQLHGAAGYFNLPGLAKRIGESLSLIIKENPSLSFDLLQAAQQGDSAAPKEITEVAMEQIRSNKPEVLNADALVLLNPSMLQEILKDEKHNIPEIELFNLLKKWADATGVDGNDRGSVAAELSKHIRFELIDPLMIKQVVSSSGFVPKGQLLEAYEVHALATRRLGGIKGTRMVPEPPVWRDTATDTVSAPHLSSRGVQLLDYPEITSGIHQWTIEIKAHCSGTWLGVVHSGFSIDKNKFAGSHEGGWMYGHTGRTYHAGKNTGTVPMYGVGSKVTLKLDLTRGEVNGGSLTAQVDGGAPFNLFQNLRSDTDGRLGGFVPAASLYNQARVRILEIFQLQD